MTRHPQSPTPAAALADDRPAIVYVVDDDPHVRTSVKFLLESAGYTVRTFATGQEFLAAQPFAHASCVLLDERLPDLTGREVLACLRELDVAPSTIFVTAFPSTDLVVRMMREGALGVLEKPIDKDALFDALRNAGGPAARRTSERDELRRLEDRFHELRPREQETLDLMVHGLGTTRQLSEALGISTRTVEGYRSQLLTKTGCQAIAEVVRLELRRRELRERFETG